MNKKVVCVYDSRATAEIVANELANSGFPLEHIHVNLKNNYNEVENKIPPESHNVFQSMRNELENFFHSVIDDDEKEMTINNYLNALKQGYAILSIDVQDDDDACRAAKIMDNLKSIHFLDLSYTGDHIQKNEKSAPAPAKGISAQFQNTNVNIFSKLTQ